MLSTVHDGADGVKVRRNAKIDGQHQAIGIDQPACIADYNNGIGGVDIFDQHIAAYRCLRKSNKYWKSIAVDMLEVAVVNSYILFNMHRSAHPNEIQ